MELPKMTVDSGSGELTVRANLIKIIHGYVRFDEDGERPDEKASIIVAEFKFLSKNQRPISSAVVGLSVAGLSRSEDAPSIYNIAPKNSFSIEPADNPNGDGKFTSAGRIRVGRSGKKDTARWDLQDNGKNKGLPQCFQVAVLVHGTAQPFLTTFEVNASITNDTFSINTISAGSSGRNITDDPIIITWKNFSSENHDGIDLDHLEKVDLKVFTKISGTNIVYRQRPPKVSTQGLQNESIRDTDSDGANSPDMESRFKKNLYMS